MLGIAEEAPVAPVLVSACGADVERGLGASGVGCVVWLLGAGVFFVEEVGGEVEEEVGGEQLGNQYCGAEDERPDEAGVADECGGFIVEGRTEERSTDDSEGDHRDDDSYCFEDAFESLKERGAHVVGECQEDGGDCEDCEPPADHHGGAG